MLSRTQRLFALPFSVKFLVTTVVLRLRLRCSNILLTEHYPHDRPNALRASSGAILWKLLASTLRGISPTVREGSKCAT
jgi:hypothetical protein